MLKRGVCLLAATILCCTLVGCAVPTSVGGYFENRWQDLIDVVHVDFGAINVGAVAYAGPFLVGMDYQTGLKSREQSATLQIGLGGPRILGRRGMAAGILWPASKWDEEKTLVGSRPKRGPSGFSAGASVGALAGVGAEADVLEALDFIVGLVCLDVMEDDEYLDDDDDDDPDKEPEKEPKKD
jgi:hypothetical protein